MVAPGPGGDHHDPAGTQQQGAAGEDLGDAVQEGVEAVVGEVDRVAAVAVVVFGDTVAGGVDLAVDAGPVRRGGDHQRDLAPDAGGGELGELAGVAADDFGGADGAVAAGVGDPGGGQFRPPGLVFDADGVAARWMASMRVVPIPHIGSATRSPGAV